ncbi:MAG: c-type cytochrome [Isosphaeraceae bacterium]|nr:c-type cytochrome [Isosphaeraceae bacterium]
MNRRLLFVPWFLILIAGLASADEPDHPEHLPRARPLEPAEAGGSFRVLHDFRLDLLAAEPLVMDPVAAAYDEDGRLYVVEMSDYPHVDPANDKPFAENTDDPPIGRVRLLIDHDGDGRFDEGRIFADKLSWPTGIAVWKRGIFVAATPDIWYLRDTDGDGRADERRRVYTGFRKFNVQAVMNNLQWGLDHRIYGAGSSNGGLVRPVDREDVAPVNVLRRDFRFDPASGRIEAISGGARFGNTFDDWGNRFICDIRNPAEHVVLPARYLERNSHLPATRTLHDAAEAGDAIRLFRISPPEPWRELRARRWAALGKAMPRSELVGAGFLTSSSGITAYRGDAYPAEYRGNLFLGEVANNLIHRMTVEPDGVTFRACRADPKAEFVASTDTWFRPVNFVNAPDGTLHVLDMYRETIEHPWSIPDDIRAQLDLRSGEDRGRIYRLTPPGFRPRPTPRLSEATTADLVALLEHPNAWHRETAHRLLYERQDRSAAPALRRLLHMGKVPLGRLHALWSLEGLGELSDEDLAVGLSDEAPGVREHAIRLSEPRLNRQRILREKVLGLADDETIRIRFQVAFTLGEVEDDRTVSALVAIARRDAADPWMRTAILSSATRQPAMLFEALVRDEEGAARFAASQDGLALLRPLAFQIGARGRPEEVERLLKAQAWDRSSSTMSLDQRLDLTLALADGLRRGGRQLFRLPVGREAADLLQELTRHARRTITSGAAPPDQRARAVALFGYRPLAEAKEVLPPLLGPGEPQEVRLAAARALAAHPEPEVAAILLRPWDGYTPTVRAEVLQLLLGREAWIGPLLDAIEAKTVAVGLIPPAHRALLLQHKSPAIRERAKALLSAEAPGPRSEAIARYQEALTLPAERDRGRKVFERECLGCHRLGTIGHEVGPNLASIRRRTPDEILIHVLDPNREVAPEFLEYAITLQDGRTTTGLIASETATGLTLKRAEGASETLLRGDIEQIASTGKSLMPEGLETRISPQEMADLIAFLLELQQ